MDPPTATDQVPGSGCPSGRLTALWPEGGVLRAVTTGASPCLRGGGVDPEEVYEDGCGHVGCEVRECRVPGGAWLDPSHVQEPAQCGRVHVLASAVSGEEPQLWVGLVTGVRAVASVLRQASKDPRDPWRQVDGRAPDGQRHGVAINVEVRAS